MCKQVREGKTVTTEITGKKIWAEVTRQSNKTIKKSSTKLQETIISLSQRDIRIIIGLIKEHLLPTVGSEYTGHT